MCDTFSFIPISTNIVPASDHLKTLVRNIVLESKNPTEQILQYVGDRMYIWIPLLLTPGIVIMTFLVCANRLILPKKYFALLYSLTLLFVAVSYVFLFDVFAHAQRTTCRIKNISSICVIGNVSNTFDVIPDVHVAYSAAAYLPLFTCWIALLLSWSQERVYKCSIGISQILIWMEASLVFGAAFVITEVQNLTLSDFTTENVTETHNCTSISETIDQLEINRLTSSSLIFASLCIFITFISFILVAMTSKRYRNTFFTI